MISYRLVHFGLTVTEVRNVTHTNRKRLSAKHACFINIVDLCLPRELEIYEEVIEGILVLPKQLSVTMKGSRCVKLLSVMRSLSYVKQILVLVRIPKQIEKPQFRYDWDETSSPHSDSYHLMTTKKLRSRVHSRWTLCYKEMLLLEWSCFPQTINWESQAEALTSNKSFVASPAISKERLIRRQSLAASPLQTRRRSAKIKWGVDSIQERSRFSQRLRRMKKRRSRMRRGDLIVILVKT